MKRILVFPIVMLALALLACASFSFGASATATPQPAATQLYRITGTFTYRRREASHGRRGNLEMASG